MNRDLHPTDGARYLLERRSREDQDEGREREALELEAPGGEGGDEGGRARYRAAIYTPDAEFTAVATLGDDGSVELAATGAPDELHARLVAIARLVARDAARRRDDGMPPWPARILRWRR